MISIKYLLCFDKQWSFRSDFDRMTYAPSYLVSEGLAQVWSFDDTVITYMREVMYGSA